MLHAEAKKAIDLHKKAGRKVVIVSNNLSVMLTSTMQDWGIDQVIANELRYDGSRVVAEYAKEICYGHGKINRLKDLAYYSDIDFEKSYFYSDSFYDIPLLEFVGNPVVINADIKLARWAKRKKVEKYTWN
jgi:HAD superfamily hydrolase (TIGR01490 family)